MQQDLAQLLPPCVVRGLRPGGACTASSPLRPAGRGDGGDGVHSPGWGRLLPALAGRDRVDVGLLVRHRSLGVGIDGGGEVGTALSAVVVHPIGQEVVDVAVFPHVRDRLSRILGTDGLELTLDVLVARGLEGDFGPEERDDAGHNLLLDLPGDELHSPPYQVGRDGSLGGVGPEHNLRPVVRGDEVQRLDKVGCAIEQGDLSLEGAEAPVAVAQAAVGLLQDNSLDCAAHGRAVLILDQGREHGLEGLGRGGGGGGATVFVLRGGHLRLVGDWD